MGNCNCNDNFPDYELAHEKQIREITPTLPKDPIVVEPKILEPKRQPTHEPSGSFAQPLESFPILPEKVVETDKKLGTFRPDQTLPPDLIENNYYLKQTYKLASGPIYQGEWKNGTMNGYGNMLLPDKSLVKGYFLNNQLIGEARVIKENGNYYQGQVQNNKAHGQGTLFENGIQYTGNFVENFLQGKGSEESETYKFVGEYVNGSKSYGTLTWDLKKSIPTVYIGRFFDEQFTGESKLDNEIGEFKGTFENGKKKGRGVFKWKNGDRFEGFYNNDLKNGEGKMYNSKDVVVLQGQWQNDKFIS